MTNKITPEKARELLNMAHQGAQDGQRPVTVAAKYAPLAEAAYALAQTVAGLRYEYAVVCLVEGDVWRYARGGVLITPLEHEATWHPTREEAEAYAERRRSTAKETRVVPRLVSEPEVVA